MGQYRILSEPLGVDFMVEGPVAPNAQSTFEILKQVVPPDRMINAYESGNKDLARAAFKYGYFDQDSESDLYDIFKKAASEVIEGIGTTINQPFDDFQRDAIEGMPAEMRERLGVKVPKGKSRKATAYQTLAEAFAGYKAIGDAGNLAFSKLVGEGDEDIDASIEFIGNMMKTQSFIDDGAAIMADLFGDTDTYNDIKMERIEPDKKQAFAASLFVQPEGLIAAPVSGGIRATSNLLRNGTARKLAEQYKLASNKQFLYQQQLNRLASDAPENLVQVANDALKKATSEVDEILAKLKPYTEQKAKAGFTNQVIGKTMQGLGKGGEYLGNLTEFIRRSGVEEATTLLMRTGMPEQVAKGVVVTAIGGAADLTDGELSASGTGFGTLAAFFGPRALAAMGRSTAILGKQLTMAETTLPFFKRVGALPADNPKLSEVIVDRTDNLLIGEAASQLKPILTQSRNLPEGVRTAARVLDKTGVGSFLTGAGNVAKATVAGAALPGAFGYMVGGEEGAATALGASLPFIAAGVGYGSLLRYKNNSDLLAKQLGDLNQFKSTLTEREKANFDKFEQHKQIAVATFSQFYPDVQIRIEPMGKSGPNGYHMVDGSDSVVAVNADSPSPWGAILAHEVGHHVERHGLLPNILEEMIGNPDKGKVGIFSEIVKETGKPIVETDSNGLKYYKLSDEFRDLQKAYIDKLSGSNVSEKAIRAYETPEKFARELFAEIVAERILSGKTAKRARQSTTYKLVESLGTRLTSGGFMRKAMHSLGMATNADGSLVKGTGILGKPFKSSRELDNIVKRYEDETIGKSETEIRNERPVTKDDELDTIIASPSDSLESLQVFNNGGHFKTNPDGSLKINPITKKPEVFTPAETRRTNQALARDLTEAIKAREDNLPEGHVTLSEAEDGKLFGSGRFIDDAIIDELAQTNRYNASQISYLREASRAGREGIGNHMLLFYYAATGRGGRKYKTLKGGYRDSLVYGITITKDGNVILDTVSLDKLQKNIDYLLKRRGAEIAQAFGGSDEGIVRQNFESKFEQYLENHTKGIVNGTPESGISQKQRDFLNAAFGPVSKDQILENPTLGDLGERRAQTMATYRSRRLDRVGTINPTGNTRNILIDRLRKNLMPGRVDTSDVGDSRQFLPPMSGDQLQVLRKIIEENTDGFTVNLQGNWADRGYVVAPEKRTEFFIEPKNFNEKAVEDYIFANEDMFDLDGSHLGGWYDTNTRRYVLDAVFPIENKEAAIKTALWGDQDGIFSLYNFKTIRTKDKNGRPIIPKGFGESARSILARKPDNVSAFAQENWRKFSTIREEAGERVLSGTEGDASKAGQSEATKTEEDLGEKQFLPVSKVSVQKAEHGNVFDNAVKIDEKLADKLFLPAAAYFDPGFSATYVGKLAFAMMADRMRVGTYISRSGEEFELRGGPDHPDMPLNQQKVAWAASGNGARELESAIRRTDGIGLVVLMDEMAVASNRTFARIMLNELKYDQANNFKARRSMAKQIREASAVVRKYARKNKKQKFANYEGESLEKIEAEFDKLPYDIRKVLFSQIANARYKSKTGGIFWKDLARELIAYKNEDGYRNGDIVKVIQFDKENPIVNLSELNIPPDPTYDISFGGRSISNVKGRVSAYQVFKDQINLKALQEDKPGQIISPEGVVGPQSFGSLFFGGLSDPRLSKVMEAGSLDPRKLPPVQFPAKTGPERASLEVRNQQNLFMPQANLRQQTAPRFLQQIRQRSSVPAAAQAAVTRETLDRFR